jgi:hypothetical protein
MREKGKMRILPTGHGGAPDRGSEPGVTRSIGAMPADDARILAAAGPAAVATAGPPASPMLLQP